MKSNLLETLKQIKKENQLKKLTQTQIQQQEPEIQSTHSSKKQIRKVIEQRSKEGQKHNKNLSNLFKGVNFCFPILDRDLSPKVIQILSKRIVTHGGNVFHIGNTMQDNKCYYYLVSIRVNKVQLKQTLQTSDLYYSCLNFHYINDCITQQSLLPEQNYWIKYLQDDEEMDDERPQKQLSPANAFEVNKLNKKKQQHILKQGELPMPKLDNFLQYQIQKQKRKEQDLKRKGEIKNKQITKVQEPMVAPKTVVEIKQNNNMIIQELRKLQKIYQIEKDKGRVIAYSKAVNIVKGLPFDIKDVTDVTGIEGIGQKLKDKIVELLQTGKLNKVQSFQKNQKYSIAQQLQRVWGIGPSKAIELYNRGIHTIQQLRKNQDLLTKNQKIGLKYLQQIEQRIPRSQVTQIEQLVKQAVFTLVKNKSMHLVQACGSYRRGKESCGDVDIIIARLDGHFERDLLVKLVKRLQTIHLITDNLTMPRQSKDDFGCLSYMGICQLQGKPHRRLDIKYYNYEQFAFALLHFTGSDAFNRSLRLHARKKGYILSDHKLVPVSDEGKGKVNQNRIMCFDEKDIFDYLGVEYKKPEDRDSY